MEQSLTMDRLKRGETAVITRVQGTGAMHDRLRDLGFTECSKVTCLFPSAFGDPCAYCVKDAVIALRRTDARCVCCKTCGGNP